MKKVSRELGRRVGQLQFAPPVARVYNPLDYAREPHEAYLEKFGRGPKAVLLVGMNPGPFGMAQTGVPFGDVALVRDWMGIVGRVRRPRDEHPKRPIEGFDCSRTEVSGSRLWGWAKERYGTPERFFEQFFVANYCPLCFMESGGRNLTPDKLPAAERVRLFEACDEALSSIVGELKPRWVIGVGAFALGAITRALGDRVRSGTILHPSPASPAANRGWAAQAEAQLRALGIELPSR